MIQQKSIRSMIVNNLHVDSKNFDFFFRSRRLIGSWPSENGFISKFRKIRKFFFVKTYLQNLIRKLIITFLNSSKLLICMVQQNLCRPKILKIKKSYIIKQRFFLNNFAIKKKILEINQYENLISLKIGYKFQINQNNILISKTLRKLLLSIRSSIIRRLKIKISLNNIIVVMNLMKKLIKSSLNHIKQRKMIKTKLHYLENNKNYKRYFKIA
eukprot:TRINITY_DN2039_c0_g1_i1.p2 TRINITY_DN2039_c0_g1~~TRINITY_DN2039_c0_g1_i1.p2  ORF type:complete len:213 (-),score=-4.63 TRINITY_DN2039_c0_g1_i1:117-755(-)